MTHQWGRAPAAGKWQRAVPAWLIGVIVFAVVSGVVVGVVRYAVVWTPLQRFYLSAYTRSALASAVGLSSGTYHVLTMVTPRSRRLAIDEEVRPVRTEDGETTFVLSDLARTARSGRLAWQDLRYDHAQWHTQLRVWIYADQGLTGLARLPLLTMLAVLVAGLLVAIPHDIQWARSRRHGRRLKGPELMSIRRFNRRTRANGMAFTVERRG